MRIAAGFIVLMSLALGGCSLLQSVNLSRETVIAQGQPDGQVAYDVVKVDDAVIRTVAAHTDALFRERFKAYEPPPAQKIAVGDRVSVVIWESSPEGLFGYSLWETVSSAGLPLSAAYSSLSDLGTNRLARQTAASNASTTGGVSLQNPGTGLGAAAPVLPQTAGAAAFAQSAQTMSSFLDPAALAAPGSEPSGGADLGQGQGGQGPGGQGQAADLSALQALQKNGAATGLPQLPESPQNLGELGRPGTRIPVQMVGADGGITIPYAGRIVAAGHTPHEVESAVERRLAGKAVGPQALVMVLGSPANLVTVTGEAINGKRVPLNPGGDRLLDVIAAAGGAHASVHDTFVELSRDGVTASAPLALLVEHPEQNIFARPGDVLTLVQRPQTFSVFGATGKNAAITFDRDRLTVAEALAKSGGLDDQAADPRAVFLFRYEPDSVVKALGQPLAADAPKGLSPVAYRFDLNDAKSYLLTKQFPVRDKDVVFVANAELQPVYRFFTALQNVTGPVVTGFVVCNQSGRC